MYHENRDITVPAAVHKGTVAFGDEALFVSRRSPPQVAASVASVLCIHSFSSSSAQYRSLARRLAPRYRVLTPDLYGHGGNPRWPKDVGFTLADEAAPLEALLPDSGPVNLVGHSYGAAVALRIGAAIRDRVRSMILYEPAIWGTLSHLCPGDPATREIESLRDATIRLLDAGQFEAATKHFIDYWSGPGTWNAMAEARRPKLVATVRSLRAGWAATFSEQWSTEALRSFNVPCLLLTGTQSTFAARRAIDLLSDWLPAATVHEFDGLGHLGAITHPDRVDAIIEDFLVSTSQGNCSSRKMWSQDPIGIQSVS